MLLPPSSLIKQGDKLITGVQGRGGKEAVGGRVACEDRTSKIFCQFAIRWKRQAGPVVLYGVDTQ